MTSRSGTDTSRASRPRAQRLASKLAGPPIARLLRSTQQARRDHFDTLGAPLGRIVILGDSISELGLWNEWFPNAPMLNRGVGGETSAQVATRLDSAINAPLAVLLLIGTNDITFATPSIAIAANVRDIVDGIERRAPGSPIVLQSVMPRSLQYRDELTDLNRRLAFIAEMAGPQVHYLDLWPALATRDGTLRSEFTLDALHLNGEGYRAWTEVLAPLVGQYAQIWTKGPRP